MVKRFMQIACANWLIGHCIFSWGMPGIWIGIALLASILIFSFMFYDGDEISCACFIPLVTLPLLGCMNEFVWRIFFRCFSEGEGHRLATGAVVVFAALFISAVWRLPLVLKFLSQNSVLGIVVLLSYVTGVLLFECPIIVIVALFLMTLSVIAGNYRGAVCIGLCGMSLLLMKEFSQQSAHYLVEKCTAPRLSGFTYELWSGSVFAAYALLWKLRRIRK